MRSGTPFRAAALFSMALAAIAAKFSIHSVAFNQAANALGPYEGRGKGKTRSHDGGGTRSFQRAALKKRNTKRSRAQARG